MSLKANLEKTNDTMEQSMDMPVDIINISLDDREVANINDMAPTPQQDDTTNEDASKNML